jgi:tetratricopeptide (TPR) repeat protein
MGLIMQEQGFETSGSLYRRALDEFFLKDYQKTIEHYTKTINLDTGDGAAYFVRGIAYMELGRKREALDDYRIAINFGIHVPQDFLCQCNPKRGIN